MTIEQPKVKLCDDCFRVINNETTHCFHCGYAQDWHTGKKTVEIEE
jgi:RNA polymerase subunit RPABC4/transcription elongation factor Spt4